ncbi:glycerate kinase [Demequina sp. SO4-18]|uniref:glycerate kinase family protein n=1 Tax=Demequina sp. SO4-18 TaxID=3401026 RepID=UPI003B5A8B20
MTGPLRVAVAVDSFKGSLTSAEAGRAIARGITERIADAQVTVVPMADGGEGTVDALCHLPGAVRGQSEGTDLRGRACTVPHVRIGDAVVVESASLLGLPLLQAGPDGRPDPSSPWHATSYGLGLHLRALIEAHAPERLVVGLGGTGCTDGGAGLIVGLGGSITDAAGVPLHPEDGNPVARGAAHWTPPDLGGVELVGLTDVSSPLLGRTGAARLFGPQKGADAEVVEVLERGMRLWSHALGGRASSVPGAGAAGGLGAALAALGAPLVPGASWLLDACGPAVFAAVDLVITGEGRIDSQTALGKVPQTVATTARRAGTPVVVALAGAIEPGVAVAGVDALLSIHTQPRTLAEAMDPEVARAALTSVAGQVAALTHAVRAQRPSAADQS